MKEYISRVLAEAAENPHLELALQLHYARPDRQLTDRAYAVARTSVNPEGELALLAAALDIMDGKVPAEQSGTAFHNLTYNLLDADFRPDPEFSRLAIELVERINSAAGQHLPDPNSP